METCMGTQPISAIATTLAVLDGVRLRLRPLTLDDVTEQYVGWLNDAEVQRYSEYQFTRHTIVSVREYVARTIIDPRNHFFAIRLRDTGEHIGNVKLGPIDRHHRRGSIGILIGERSRWGYGYATEAIALLERYALDVLGLHKLTAGMYETNVGSHRLFSKLGYVEEGRRRAHCLQGDQWVNYIEFGKVSPHNRT